MLNFHKTQIYISSFISNYIKQDRSEFLKNEKNTHKTIKNLQTTQILHNVDILSKKKKFFFTLKVGFFLVWKLIDPPDASIFVHGSIIVLAVVGDGQKKMIGVFPW